MEELLNNLRALGQRRLIILGLTGLGIVAVLFLGMRFISAPAYSPLYTQVPADEAAAIVSALEADGFQVQLTAGGTTIAVPVTEIARARMSIATSGLPNQGVPGWELFDEVSGVGMNTFMQRVNRVRALEGELARSIQTIDGIRKARVHLVLPEREAFARTRPDPSASVIVRSDAGSTVSRKSALSIRALVAAAIPDLAADRVTVLSAAGETILSEEESLGEGALQSQRAEMEERLATRIANILTARVGAGNARVQVSIDMETERQVIVQRSYDPNQQVVRSTETREESSEDVEAGGGEVNVGNNLPGGLGQDVAGAPGTNSRSATDEIVNFEIGSTQSETTREPGTVRRISVAVLVNGIYNVLDDGTVEYAEREAAELDRLQGLVQAAIGFDQERGDTVSVDSLRFIDYSLEVGEALGSPFEEVLANSIGPIIRGAFAMTILAVVFIFGVRPLLAQLAEITPQPQAYQLAGAGAPVAAAAGIPGPGPQPQPVPGEVPQPPPLGTEATVEGEDGQARSVDGDVLDPEPDEQDELIALASVEGGVQKRRLTAIETFVDENPEETLQVIQSWLVKES